MKPKAHSGGTQKEQVAEMFDSISRQYDLLNRLLSLGVDRWWRKSMAKRVRRHKPQSVLDVATGTGDSAIALKKCGAARIVGVDIAEQMLKHARKKPAAAGIEFVKADGERLPFDNGCFDAVTIAFGIRNFEQRRKGLQEMQRVLKQNGLLVVLELSMPANRIMRRLYKLYFLRVVPALGKLVSRNSYAYRYLPCSVDEFPPQQAFAAEIKNAGFERVKATALSGGLATIYEAKKK
ncbi:MAG: bifunctional demethylmenaquinone methyltransferase/2-methoxy-6-polyprenyl-1,4-benzoquinol methylase UbiE [Prevotellaceae bacterium]|jgi:demethylmenaquinone methyltransferase/2-methoxy-6-polyprenyl-1,4-benzoquinol methylase|nr:bifunctional demethylmenaquinone methyltransferase/2-methoxy-6-polyprenyl-1,4-benzoquinol methylase UbiE [Prevotellaceae bacterium]